MKNYYSIVIHGGGGSWDGETNSKKEELKKICDKAKKILENDGSAQDAVEKAINLMEEHPLFNAGFGSALNIEGNVEVEASIMNSSKSKPGSINAAKNILYPITIAREVMDNSDHVILSGEGANHFAKLKGYNETDNLITKKRKQEYKQNLEILKEFKINRLQKLSKLIEENKDKFFSTVGAVAFDGESIVAGTSTGGTPLKMRGRVGDSSIPGAGNYADKNCGISTTGIGEICLSRNTAVRIAMNLKELQEAMNQEIEEISNQFGKGNTSIIGINSKGEICVSHNTEKFAYAYATSRKESKGDILPSN